MSKVQTGLDVLVEEDFKRLKGARIGLLVHPASVDSRLAHAVDLFQASRNAELVRLFGPQHGIQGETQDNMIEWKGYDDPVTGLRVYSLYGEHRKPTPEMLDGLDVLVVDLQDVGARPYTFIWTTCLCMLACAQAGVKVMVLDRPNPVGGLREGPMLDMGYASFVGMAPIPLRHGLTAGETARFCNRALEAGAELEVVPMRDYDRGALFDRTGLPWVLPSPNLPTLESCVVYPGFVLLEGTELSEGRGTTRPFEIAGAPYIDPRALAGELRKDALPGVVFRPLRFQPAFQKHAGKLCGGVQVHVTAPGEFRPVLTAVSLIAAVRRLYPEHFAWKQPPYEYEARKLPIDILAGSDHMRTELERGRTPQQLAGVWARGCQTFERTVVDDLLYG